MEVARGLPGVAQTSSPGKNRLTICVVVVPRHTPGTRLMLPSSHCTSCSVLVSRTDTVAVERSGMPAGVGRAAKSPQNTPECSHVQ